MKLKNIYVGILILLSSANTKKTFKKSKSHKEYPDA